MRKGSREHRSRKQHVGRNNVRSCRRRNTVIVVAWLALGVALVAVELHHLAFFALFGAIGAFAAAAVAMVAPGAVGLQLACAVGAAGVGIGAVRPYVSRAFLHPRGDTVAPGVHGGFIGEVVSVLDTVTSTPGGHVRLVGERWLARSSHNEILVAGTKATVVAVNGTTLTVSADPKGLKPSTHKMEQLREQLEHIVDSRVGDSGDIRDGADLRPPPDDQHRPAG
jgi:membrane protein implicated in regulation of membrane protease activity